MFSHVFVGISDFDRAFSFYQPLMASLGIQLRFCEPDRPWAGWQSSPEARPLWVLAVSSVLALAGFSVLHHVRTPATMLYLVPFAALVSLAPLALPSARAPHFHAGSVDGSPACRLFMVHTRTRSNVSRSLDHHARTSA